MHELYMQRCIEIARTGAGKVSPNPMVGCVIVLHNKIIGEGWHREYGWPHAEVNAIIEVKDSELLKDATLYVNMEPCCHIGKTPPCVDLIIAKKIKQVIVGMVDPNPLVSGMGIQKLRDAGIAVQSGVLENDCRELNKRFITFFEKKKPFVILKWAQTQNGFLSPDSSKMSAEKFEEERHITGKIVQKLVHKWRTEESAIMIGTHTALTDNPALNAREWIGKLPLRVVLDRTLRLPKSLKIFDQTQATWIINEREEREEGNLKFVKLDFEGDWLDQLLTRLYLANIQSLIVEGGAKLLNHFIEREMWDEAIVFYSPKQITDGVKAPFIGGEITQQIYIDQCQMTQYKRL